MVESFLNLAIAIYSLLVQARQAIYGINRKLLWYDAGNFWISMNKTNFPPPPSFTAHHLLFRLFPQSSRRSAVSWPARGQRSRVHWARSALSSVWTVWPGCCRWSRLHWGRVKSSWGAFSSTVWRNRSELQEEDHHCGSSDSATLFNSAAGSIYCLDSTKFLIEA